MCFCVDVWFYCVDATEYTRLYVYPEALLDMCVCVRILTERQTVFRLCRRSRASWGLDRYWGSSACSSRMENGTMDPGQDGGRTRRKQEMCEGRNRVGWGHIRREKEREREEKKERGEAERDRKTQSARWEYKPIHPHTDCTQPWRQEPTDGIELRMAAY